MRVLIAAQVRLYREGLAQAFSLGGEYDVVGSASTSLEAMDLVRDLAPDILLVEHAMPRADSLVREVVERSRTKVVVLGVEEVREEIIPLIEEGICGYVTREGSIADLFAAVDRAARGEWVCSPRVVAGMMERLAALTRERRSVDGTGALTAREREIASLMDEGLSNRDIARRLEIQLPTVKNHVHNILEKLHVHRRGEAVARLRTPSLSTPMSRRN
jgi:two-component system, NarL family, nitrate/nitrite response regulator NarL